MEKYCSVNGFEEFNFSINESEIWVKGLIPYAFGDNTAHRLIYGGEYVDIDGFESLSELDSVVLGLVSLNDAEVLSSAGKDERSLLLLHLISRMNHLFKQ